jgi:signal transduction histidine kinase
MKPRAPSSFAAPLERPAWQSYGYAVLLLLGATACRWLLDPYIQGAMPLATMYMAVAFAVWLGGWKPAALIAIAGCFLGLWMFVSPRFTPKLWGDLGPMRVALYFVSCVITISVCEAFRQARKRHAASEQKVVSILEQMRESFCSVAPDWRITSVNRSAEVCLRRSRDAIIGRQFWEIIPASAGTPAETQLRLAMREGVPVQFETNVFAPRAWHDVTATRVNGELSIFFQDVTAKRAHLDELERLVDDRTAALQRIVAELESFSYTLVHDMRAPLRSIAGFAELLAVDHAQQLDADGKRHLGRIQRSAARMDQLIMDILDYSQLSRTQPELRPIDLNETFREILQSHSDFQSDKAHIEVEGALPVVRGNDALLTQCFSNLLHNGIKFVAPGVKPCIHVKGSVHGEIARIDISDNGIGIAPEAIARIFEPFRREHAQYDGTGIGLAIVQKVVDQLGGRVGVESNGGTGSRFWVELKVSATPAATGAAPAVESRVRESSRTLVLDTPR